jgi:type III secretory pathway component EscS
MAGPPVIVVAIVGLLIAFIQAATQLQEQTFQYAAKFIAIVMTIFLTASLAGTTLYHFTDRLFSEFVSLVR